LGVLFCDDEYRDRLREDLTKPWADIYEALLSLAKTAVIHDGMRQAGFFFAVDARREFVLGPHWIADPEDRAPFIRRSYDHAFWRPLSGDGGDRFTAGRQVRQPMGLDGGNWEWAIALQKGLLFYGISGGEAILGAEHPCWESLRALIPFDLPDLSPG
jgi:hypothetical protein